MLYPHRQPWFSRWFSRMIERRLRARFSQVTVHGAVHGMPARAPLLLVANHSSYWDALLIVWLSERVLGTPGYAWMHRHNLARLPFFRLLGAFGVDGRSPADIKAGVTFAGGLLRGPPCALWLFPQGDEKPASLRPLGFAGGSAWIARRYPDIQVVPVAIHYGFGALEKPEVQVCFGAPMAGAEATPAQHEAAVVTLLDACAGSSSQLAQLAPVRQSYLPDVSAKGDDFATRCLSALCRWYLDRFTNAGCQGPKNMPKGGPPVR